MRFYSNDAQYWWCEKIALSQVEFLSNKNKECASYSINDFIELLAKNLNSTKERNSKILNININNLYKIKYKNSKKE